MAAPPPIRTVVTDFQFQGDADRAEQDASVDFAHQITGCMQRRDHPCDQARPGVGTRRAPRCGVQNRFESETQRVPQGGRPTEPSEPGRYRRIMAVDNEYTVDTDLARIDLSKIHHWLSTDAYWALGRTRETVQRAAEGSLNFGVYYGDGDLCAYARVVTDEATFAWLCDVYVDRNFRGRGLGQLLSQAVVDTLLPMNLKPRSTDR